MNNKYRAKIVVCIPLSWDFVPRPFFLNCLGMSELARDHGIELIFITNQASVLDRCRDKLVDEALKDKPDYILWLDADQIYPRDLPELLMRHMSKSRLVVGGVVPCKSTGKPLIYEFTKLDGRFSCRRLVKPLLNQGLIEIDALGWGGIMVDPKVFDKIPFPRFKRWCTSTAYVGDDIEFFRQCSLKGIKAWCDTDIHCGHLALKPVMLKEGGKNG